MVDPILCHYIYMGIICAGAVFIVVRERRLRAELRGLAHYDELTGCVNFRWITEILENEVIRCKRYHKGAAVIMMDIDHFKKINDRHGHIAGNLILKVFADTLKKNVRNVDVVGRYGGEEFLIVLPEANREEALIVLERVRSRVLNIPLPLLVGNDNVSPSLHFSAGIASFPLNGENAQELISVADRALYEAKTSGRNKIIVERRSSARVKPLPGLKAEVVSPSDKGVLPVIEIINISKKGMLVSIPKDLDAKEFLCRIKFPSLEKPFEAVCNVAHKKKAGEDLYFVGFSFTGAPKELEKEITYLIKRSIFESR